ncbi:MAG: ABC transporter substrate-binding protein [Caldimonas sp.]
MLPRGARAQGAVLRDAVLATPGPASSVSLIPELAVAIGADRTEGLAVRIKFVSGGGVAIRELLSGNVQFGVFGITAAMNENLRGDSLVALAAVENLALLSLMVRSDLRPVVRRIEDLQGRVLGIHSNSLATMTNGQQFLMLLLRQHKVSTDSVRFVAAGQSWESQSSALRGNAVDALVSEEPFSSRLEQAGLAYRLFSVGQNGESTTLPGVGFLRGTLIARRSIVDAQPDLAQRMVRTLQQTLAWRAAHSPADIVSALGLSGDEGSAFLAMLKGNPTQFSPDGKFSDAQLLQTETFFRESLGNTPESLRYRVGSMLADRWAGHKP